MNKIKLFLGVALFGAMSFGAFSAYEYATMSEEDRFFLANIEALTTDEPGGGSHVPGYDQISVDIKDQNGNTVWIPCCMKDEEHKLCASYIYNQCHRIK